MIPDGNLQRLPTRYVVIAMVFVLSLVVWVEGVWLFPNYGAGDDEASYLLAAKGLALRGDPVYENSDELAFVPEHMIESKPGAYYPIYPIGYPMLCAAAYKVGGAVGPFYVNPVCVVVGLIGVYFLARFFVGELYALAAVFFLGMNPALLYYAVTPMSHASDLACAVWCGVAGYAWYRRPAWWKAGAAGLLAGYAVSIRYTEALLVLPLGYLLLLRGWERWRARKGVDRGVIAGAAWMAAGGIVALVPLLWFHAHAFGSIWRTGYSFTGHSSAFSWDYFTGHALVALKALWQIPFGVSLFFPLGVAGLLWGLARRTRESLFLVLWCVPGLILYMAYYWVIRDDSGGWLISRGTVLYVRLYLTLYPLFVIAGLMLVTGVLGSALWKRIVVVAATVGLGAVHLYFAGDFLGHYEGSAVSDEAATVLVRRHLPANAVILADGYAAYSLVYFTDMTVFYPSYFSREWVRGHLQPPDVAEASPAFWNPLRRERFAALAGNKTGEELDALLAKRLLFYAGQGREVGLVVNWDSPPWYQMLDGAFTRETIAEDSANHLVLYELKPRAAGEAGGEGAVR